MASTPIGTRLKSLKAHLSQENPILLDAIASFTKLDKVGYSTGLLDKEESFAVQIPWWPLVAVLGTYSAGKSTFINHFIGESVQRSGNQAVDDKFTVICYSPETNFQALPGVALDADPRFPFYRISDDIEKVAVGEGSRIDSYIQLKTSTSEKLRGKIIIDSPGFDADKQRDSTLRITDHIIDLSDLVLVFFDARHPEPGAMRDTLDHLVSNTINRDDSSKFLYILNQIDTSANDNNSEEVVAAWQRALGERGLTAGRFYTIYSPDVAVPIADTALRQRYEEKRDLDLGEIHNRMQQIEVERAYRIVGSLENTAREIETKAMPALKGLLSLWKRRTFILDAMGFMALIGAVFLSGVGSKLINNAPVNLFGGMMTVSAPAALMGLLLMAWCWHIVARLLAKRSLRKRLRTLQNTSGHHLNFESAFDRSTALWVSIFTMNPKGWSILNRRRVDKVRAEADQYVQNLNDRYTSPSGKNMVEVQSQQLVAKDEPKSDHETNAAA